MICESELELARLPLADFDVSVGHIVAQPFLLKAGVVGAVRGHIPDYLLPIDVGPLVVEYFPDRAEESPSAPPLVPGQDHAAGKRPRLDQVQVHPAVQRGEERGAAAHQNRMGG